MLDLLRDQGLLDDGSREVMRVPEQLGPYCLREQIGEGGMGVVFAADDTENARRVAIKFVRPDMVAYQSSRRRFENEIAAISKLNHPGIAQVYDSGEQQGLHFYVMELVDGQSLGQILGDLAKRESVATALQGSDLFAGEFEPVDQPSSTRTALASASWIHACLRIVRDVGNALAHSHELGIVHRDVKPGNVMLDHNGCTRLLDFGLARDDEAQTLTRTGTALGSLAYMSPEQLLGERDKIDSRSDIYSLGVVLFELLTLQSPFLVPGNAEATRARILRGRAPSLRRFNPEISRETALVCLRAMARKRDRRYTTISQFSGDLDALMTNRPVAAGSVFRRFVLHRPIMVGVTAAITAMGLAGLGLRHWNLVDESARHATEHGTMAATTTKASKVARAARLAAYRGQISAAQRAILNGEILAAKNHLDLAPEEHRAWEWQHLMHRTRIDSPGWALQGVSNDKGLYKVRVAKGGEELVLGVGNNTVIQCRRSDGKILDRDDYPRGTQSRVFNRDGSVYAYVLKSDRHRIHLCDPARNTAGPADVGATITTTGLSADGRRAAAAYASGCALIDVATRRILHRFNTGDDKPWKSVIFFANGSRLACQRGSSRIEIWDCETGKLEHHADFPTGGLAGVAAAGNQLYVTVSGHEILRLDQSNLRRLGSWDIEKKFMGVIADPDGVHVWTHHHDGVVRCWHPASQQPLLSLPGHGPRLATPCFDRALGRILIGNVRSRHLWDRDLAALKSGWLALPHRRFLCAEPGPDGSLLAFSGGNDTWFRTADGEIHVLDVPRLGDAKFLDAHRMLASDFATGDILVFEVPSGKIVTRMKGHSREVTIVGRLADSRAVSCGRDGTIRIWDLDARQCQSTLTGQPDTFEAAVLADGRRFLTGHGDGTVRLWTLGPRPADKPRVDLLLGGLNRVYGLAVSPDGQRLVAGDMSGTVVVYDLDERCEIARFKTGAIADLTFSPDGRRLLIGGLASTSLRVYDTATWTELIALQGHTSRIAEVAFAADGTTLTSTDDAGFVRLWRSR